MGTRLNRAAAGTANYVDERTSIGGFVKFFARKLFPDHWSFMLGEIALYSFIILLLSGVFLTAFFVPSMTIVTYDGPLETMQGVEMSEAFASTLHMSFEVPGGLLMRQIHHWAALLFTAAIVTHMARVFFTGAFRKPRELNWLVGFTLMILSLAAGFSGYSLPDDVLSGNGLRIIEGVTRSIPILGEYISFWIFGGEFPGEILIPRLFTMHILLVPGLILALIALHLFLVFLHKHTQYPGGGRTHKNVVGLPLFPVYTAKAGGFFFVVFGVVALVAALFTINPVWNYGPYDPSPVSAGTQPDWYILFIDGALRLMPGWLFDVIPMEWEFWGYTLSWNLLIPAVILPGLFFGFLALYPWIEAWATGDRGEKHVLDRPRNAPVRTGLGVALITFYVILVMEGSNDIIANLFHLSLNDLTYFFRIGIFVIPVLAFWITRRIAFGLQRKDRELVLHGNETGRIVRHEHGEYIEVHEPLDEQERWLRVGYEDIAPLEIEPEFNDRGVRRKGYRWDRFKQRLSRFYFEQRISPVTPEELEEAQHAHH
ncbi:cytochrome bc complex cytochrome b subunit [Demequina sp. SYSU T00039]|uniref:Cytochrome bc1 complex cytochrome b subunit n=1 Tax=Demequina lignilytica TaxID=3051663 RepID=A0AAW7M7T3_9MICO|nr:MULTISPECIES: cytochrome bc complex cytochrome b subunit [unclassified Demequina]MDN4486821.1 cytochrome bc complex cytochrome b subunit [Demequina sp. SYSU T00039]MDN4489505.1 cytochrome bc complex cytochrome b subunit [Demequina sp. SYSU T00068]